MSPRASLVLSGRRADGRSGWVRVSGDRITDVGSGRPAGAVDVHGTLVPGFVDVHVHGGGGRQVAGRTPEEVAANIGAIGQHHARHGTTAMLATTVSDTPEALRIAAQGAALSGALGLHLEGPWLAPGRAGAHDPHRLRPPALAELDRLHEAASGVLRLLTVAPELPGALELIAHAAARGITVSVGHTAADFTETQRAFAAGARHVTHLGNAMGPVDRREPGPVAAALLDDRVTCEVIADGHHLHPGFLMLAARAAPGRLVAVTDAAAACGLPPGPYHLGGRAVVLEDGRVALADHPGTLAGSVLTMDAAVANLVAAGLDLPGAVVAASTVPARVAGAPGKGHLRPGADADVVVLDDDLRTAITLIGGRCAWDRDDRLGG